MQQSNRMKIFSKFAQSIKHLTQKEILEQLHEKYYIREFKIWEINPSIATSLYLGIVTRTKKYVMDKSQFRWLQNQLRIFVWTLTFYSFSKNIDISQMINEDWDFFSMLFPNKDKILFEYQATTLLKNHNQYKKWTFEQDQLFEQLVKKDNYRLRWSELGKSLFIESDKKYFRTSKQCRERWLNHLDPSKLKKYWLESQDFTLIEYVKYYGKKWAIISKKLDNKRNQHSIKNRFKSLLTKESKICLQPCSENQLIENIYYKLLKSISVNKEEQTQKMVKQVQKQPQQNEFLDEQKEHSLFQHPKSNKSQSEIYDYDDFPQNLHMVKKQKDILGDLSLNQGQKSSQIKVKGSDNQVFEFTKLNGQISDLKCSKNEKEENKQVQKRVRADLFLQQDPFELLRSYFYRQTY